MRTNRLVVVNMIVAAAAATAGLQAQTRDGSAALEAPLVLFMCPHGAAKSVLASAYFERLAKERGLNVRVESAGTDPDPTVSPAVVAHLKRQGYQAPKSNPRKVTPKDLESADVVISIGCDLSGLPEPRGELVRWDEVPVLSEDFAPADEAIRKRVTELIEKLVRSAPKKRMTPISVLDVRLWATHASLAPRTCSSPERCRVLSARREALAWKRNGSRCRRRFGAPWKRRARPVSRRTGVPESGLRFGTFSNRPMNTRETASAKVAAMAAAARDLRREGA